MPARAAESCFKERELGARAFQGAGTVKAQGQRQKHRAHWGKRKLHQYQGSLKLRTQKQDGRRERQARDTGAKLGKPWKKS